MNIKIKIEERGKNILKRTWLTILLDLISLINIPFMANLIVIMETKRNTNESKRKMKFLKIKYEIIEPMKTGKGIA